MTIAQAENARNKVLAKGGLWTFQQFDRSVDDSAMPWRATADPLAAPNQTESVAAIRIPPSGVSTLGLSTEQADRLKRSEAILIVAPGAPFTPLLEDFDVVIDPNDTTQWMIENTEVLMPYDVRILLYMGIRR